MAPRRCNFFVILAPRRCNFISWWRFLFQLTMVTVLITVTITMIDEADKMTMVCVWRVCQPKKGMWLSGLGVLRTRRPNQIWSRLPWRVRKKWNKLLVKLFVTSFQWHRCRDLEKKCQRCWTLRNDFGSCTLNWQGVLKGGLITILTSFLKTANNKDFSMWCYTDEASKEWEYCAPPGEVSPFFFSKTLPLCNVCPGFGHCLYGEWAGLHWRMCNSGRRLLVIS